MIPTLKHYSGIVSDIPSGSILICICSIFILTFYLTFLLAYTLTIYLTFYLASILTYFLAFYLATILTYILVFLLAFSLTYFLAFYLASIWHSIWHLFWHTFWHSFWHLFWHSFWYSFWHSLWHTFWHSIWHLSDILSGIYSDILSGILSGIYLTFSLASGLAVPTEIWHQRLRPRNAHWDLEVAVEEKRGERWGGESNSDKICRPSPGRWGTTTERARGTDGLVQIQLEASVLVEVLSSQSLCLYLGISWGCPVTKAVVSNYLMLRIWLYLLVLELPCTQKDVEQWKNWRSVVFQCWWVSPGSMYTHTRVSQHRGSSNWMVYNVKSFWYV